VIPQHADSPPTLADLRAAVSECLPTFCAPKELRLVTTLPRTALGKVQRHLLAGSPSRPDDAN
jgi:acyl-coenzyme A synthetase/AMP-(fatty) acid ligase